MPRNAIKYKDVWVAPNSDLYNAIMSKDMKKADEIYSAAISKYNKEFGVA